MLSLDAFNQLSEPEKFAYIWQECLFLESRQENETLRANLYYAGSFFIEVFYDGYHNEFRAVSPFQTSKRLMPYVSRISIRNLF